MPLLPLNSPEDLKQDPKETLSLKSHNRLTLRLSKSSIGELEVEWVGKGGPKEWKFKFHNTPMAREFMTLVEKVRRGQHQETSLKQSVLKSRGPQQIGKVNKTTTSFISNIKKLEEEKVKKSGLTSLLLGSMAVNDNAQP